MHREERIDDPETSLMVALRGHQTNLWTAMPGIIQSFDPVKMTCVVQPAIQAEIDVSIDLIKLKKVWPNLPNLPLLVDCPVFFPAGGGYTLTFPITAGDECLVVFASRCIDAWWQNGGTQPQTILRMHDLSDGFVFVGVNSQPRVLPGISTNSTQLRDNSGDTYVEIEGTSINVVATTAVTIAAPTVTVNSTNATVNASATAKVKAASILLQNGGAALKKLVNDTFVTLFNSHVHGNGNGGANTTAPTTTAGSTHTTSTVQAE